jgi:rhodanese-related sulfurtransferase
MSARARSEVATRRLRDGDRIELGRHMIEIIESPGHTDDSVSLLVDDTFFTGDALLIGGGGRTDFQNGSPEALYDTLHRRFRDLPDALTIYPAHGYAGRTHSTVQQERAMNPLLLMRDREQFVTTLRAAHQPEPANMEAIVAANVRGVRPSQRMAPEELARLLEASGPTGAPLIVDVRLPAEYRALHLEPSLSMPLDELARRRAELPRHRDLVLVCRTGARARVAAEQLRDFPTRVLEGGLVAWQAAGYPVTEGKTHVSLERQVRIAAGALASVGGVLAVTVSSWFGLLPALVGAGLVYAGVTDRCGMAMLLARLPYNRAPIEGSCAAPVGTCAAPLADATGRRPDSP